MFKTALRAICMAFCMFLTSLTGYACPLAGSVTPTGTVTAPSSGVTGAAITLSVPGSCNWTAVLGNPTDSSWIHITNPSGTGPSTITYTVDPYLSCDSRKGAIVVTSDDSVSIDLVQPAGCTCSASLSSAIDSPPSGGPIGLQVTASDPACKWTVTSTDTNCITPAQISGNGSNTASFTVLPHDSVAGRQCTLTLAGQQVSVTQDGCTFDTGWGESNFTPSGDTSTIVVSPSDSVCTWNLAGAPTNCITPSTHSGKGFGLENYTVSKNDSPSSRTCTFTLSNNGNDVETFIINQSGCSGYLAPAFSQPFSSNGGIGTFAVVYPEQICTWSTATTANKDWIDIPSAGSGSGAGAVTYNVHQTNLFSSRTGTILVSNLTYTVNQDGCTAFINPLSSSFANAGGTGNFDVYPSNPSCAWTANLSSVPTPTWIHLSSGASGTVTGAGTVSYTVDQNCPSPPSPPSPLWNRQYCVGRTGTITAAGQDHTVHQDGSFRFWPIHLVRFYLPIRYCPTCPIGPVPGGCPACGAMTKFTFENSAEKDVIIKKLVIREQARGKRGGVLAKLMEDEKSGKSVVKNGVAEFVLKKGITVPAAKKGKQGTATLNINLAKSVSASLANKRVNFIVEAVTSRNEVLGVSEGTIVIHKQKNAPKENKGMKSAK